MNRENLISLAQKFSEDTGENMKLSTHHQVFIDYGEVVSLLDADTIIKNLHDMENRIRIATSGYAVEITNYLKRTIIYDYLSWVQNAKITFGSLVELIL